MSLEDRGIPLQPLRPAIFAFRMDERGFKLICEMIGYWQQRYGMTLAQSVDLLNGRLGARDGHDPAEITADSWWFHETMEHNAREMIEGAYWMKQEPTGDARP